MNLSAPVKTDQLFIFPTYSHYLHVGQLLFEFWQQLTLNLLYIK